MLAEILQYLGILMAAACGAFLAAALALGRRKAHQQEHVAVDDARPYFLETSQDESYGIVFATSRLRVEAGVIRLQLSAPLTVLRATRDAEAIPAHTVFTLSPGDAVLIPPRVAGKLHSGDSGFSLEQAQNVVSFEQRENRPFGAAAPKM